MSKKLTQWSENKIDKIVKEELKKQCAYILFDIRHQEDLKLVARAVADEINLCGSSAIGEELPAAIREMCEDGQDPVFLIAGSLTRQSIAQTEYLRGKGYPVITLIPKPYLMKEAFPGKRKGLQGRP